jgi:S-ribosylhomocysteine lyase
MEKIASFTINHLLLEPGVYLSRVDSTASGDIISTYDIRMTAPNREPALAPQTLHAIEHLAATWLRNNAEWGSRIVYWGPMGCCTGNYLILQGEHSTRTVAALMLEMFQWIATYEGEIPGATARDCGNYTFMDLADARKAAQHYVDSTLQNITDNHLSYPS